MNGNRLLLPLLIVATLIGDATVLQALRSTGPADVVPDTLFLIFYSLAVSQVSLMAVWLVRGHGRLAVRLAISGSGITAWSWICQGVLEYPILPYFFALAALVATPLCVANFFKLPVERYGTLTRPTQAPQFSLRTMFQAVTGIAILAGVMRTMWRIESVHPTTSGVAWQFTAAGVLALLACWVAYSEVRLFFRFAVMLIAGGAITYVSASISASKWIAPVMYTLPAMFVAASLGIVRMSGCHCGRNPARGGATGAYGA